MSFLARDIEDGFHDSELDEILAAVKARREKFHPTSPRKTQHEERDHRGPSLVKRGDRVKITAKSGLSPKYLYGVELEVTQVLRKNARVKVVDPEDLPKGSKWRSGFRCPMTALEPA